MKFETSLFSLIIKNAASQDQAALCIEALGAFLHSRRKGMRPHREDSANLRDKLATHLAHLSGKPEESIRIEATRHDKIMSGDGLDVRLASQIDLKASAMWFVSQRHIPAIMDGIDQRLADELHLVVSTVIVDLQANEPTHALTLFERNYHVCIVKLLALATYRGHKGAFDFACRALDWAEQVNVIGRSRDGATWRVITA